MKLLTISLALCLSLGLGCSKKDDGGEPETTESQPKTTDMPKKDTTPDKPEDPKPGEGKDEPEEAPAEPTGLKLVEFPNTKLDAEAKQMVFAPNDSSYAQAHSDEKNRKGRFSWGIVRVNAVGDVETELEGGGGSSYKIPNAYIIPIPKGAVVAEGDVVVGSKYGNTFDRALVIKAGTPPKANFMRSMPFDKESNGDLKPDRHYKLTDAWQPGAPVAVRMSGTESRSRVGGFNLSVKSPDGLELFTVVRVEGDRVLLTGHLGKIVAGPKNAAVPIPLVPELKKGDKITAVWDTLHFRDGTFVKADKKTGHFLVRWEDDKKDSRVPFGELLAGSKADYLAGK